MALTRNKEREEPQSSSSLSRNFHLPSELVFDMLSRFDVKSLLKFKSVCKTWLNLIENPNFIKSHLTISMNSVEESSMLVLGYTKMWLQFSDRNRTTCESDTIFFRYHLWVDGICDGLVWATLRNIQNVLFNPIVVINPTTGKIRRIPRPILPITISDLIFSGFGLIEIDGYCLFRIIYSHSEDQYVGVRGEVYSMTTDTWRQIEVKRGEIDPNMCLLSNMSGKFLPIVLDGVFYWQAYGYHGGHVVSFDTCQNMFEEIKWPVNFEVPGGWYMLDFKGEPAMPVPTGPLQFDLWVFDVKRRSWTKKFTLGDLSWMDQHMDFLGFARNGKLVLQHWEQNQSLERKLVSYDLESHEIRDLPFHGKKGNESFYFYSSSLLSV